MVIRDVDGFEDIDWALGQSVTTTVVAPGAPGAGMQSIPIVSLGPVQVMSRSGAVIPVVTATIRTPSTVIQTVSAPSGLFQAIIDQSAVDQGAQVIFSASGYLSTTVPAVGLVCNRGTRNELGQQVTMSNNQCSYPVYYLDSVQATIPQTPYPATYSPVSPAAYGTPYGGPGYAQPYPQPYPQYGPPAYPPPPPPGYSPSPYLPQTTPEGYYRSSDIAVEDRPKKVRPSKRPTKDETVPAPPGTSADNQAVPAPPAPGIFALTGGINPWYLAGGALVVIGGFIFLVKS